MSLFLVAEGKSWFNVRLAAAMAFNLTSCGRTSAGAVEPPPEVEVDPRALLTTA
jgi:hypothetical protein